MNKSSFTNQASNDPNVLLLSQEVDTFKLDTATRFDNLERQFVALRTEIREWMREGKPQIWRYGSIIVAIGAMIWGIIQMQINATVRDSDRATQAIAETAKANTANIANNAADLHTLARLQSSDHSERVSNEREIETQFDADSQLRNVQWANIMRRMNDYQNTLSDMGAKWPHIGNNPYFEPNISGRHSGGSNE